MHTLTERSPQPVVDDAAIFPWQGPGGGVEFDERVPRVRDVARRDERCRAAAHVGVDDHVQRRAAVLAGKLCGGEVLHPHARVNEPRLVAGDDQRLGRTFTVPDGRVRVSEKLANIGVRGGERLPPGLVGQLCQRPAE